MKIVQAPPTDALARAKKKAQEIYNRLNEIKMQVAHIVKEANVHPNDYEYGRRLAFAETRLNDVLDGLR